MACIFMCPLPQRRMLRTSMQVVGDVLCCISTCCLTQKCAGDFDEEKLCSLHQRIQDF